jgi:predicted DNA-binding transcriptional regulator YafY
VVLKFQPKDGKYVLTQPLHHSQRNVDHDGPEVIIELNVIINFELTGIILSYGASVEVVEPASLREKILSISQKITDLYTSNKPGTPSFI